MPLRRDPCPRGPPIAAHRQAAPTMAQDASQTVVAVALEVSWNYVPASAPTLNWNGVPKSASRARWLPR
eukprot:3263638-Pyramimonas_sp.AAC.1